MSKETLDKTEDSSPILLARTDRIGDVLLTTTCLLPLHQTFPSRPIDFYVQPALAELLKAETVANVVPCPNPRMGKGISPRRILHWAKIMRQRAYGMALFLQPDNDLQIAAVLAGIPIRVGYRQRCGRWALNRSLPYLRHRGEKHETAYNFDILSLVGCQEPETLESRIVETEKIRSIRQSMAQERLYVVFHPTAFGKKPTWPLGHFEDLAGLLATRCSWDIRLIGDEPMTALQKALQRRVGSHGTVHDHGGKTDLQELAAILKSAQVFVGRDSGPCHMASALGVPLVCLMGQCDRVHSPVRWQPLGERSKTLVSELPSQPGESREARWKRCFQALSPQQVLSAIEELCGN